MSQENAKLVRRAYEHFGATGEFIAEDFHPRFVMDLSTFKGWPERLAYYGVEGVREFMAGWLEPWETFEQEVKNLLDAGDKVVAIMYQRGRSRNGITVGMGLAHVWYVVDGRLIRLEGYAQASEALAAAGVREGRDGHVVVPSGVV
jgi:ketosteroid isomerase-like protein